MPTSERCRARAEEAERLASVVSYERDRERLLGQAQEWRARAEQLELLEREGRGAADVEPSAELDAEPEPEPGLVERVRRWLAAR